MGTPGFSAEAAVHGSSSHYRPAAFDLRPSMEGSIKPEIGQCTPHCFGCVPDSSSSTGCSRTCILANCEDSTIECRGCACPAGLTKCGTQCVDLSNDPTNCGACRNVCVSGVCKNRSCVVCQPGFTACPDGSCADLNNDMQNCGSCHNICPPGSTSCQGGTCYPTPRVCGPCTRNCDVDCCSGTIIQCHPNPQTNSTCSEPCCYDIAPGQQSCNVTECACL